jgi:hypothetical protein
MLLPTKSCPWAFGLGTFSACLFTITVFMAGCNMDDAAKRPTKKRQAAAKTKLSHDEALHWIGEHHAWRHARKTKPIWARELDPDEIGKSFTTADHADEVAREGYWLCVGVAGEPWFQKPAKVEEKYDESGEEEKQFSFDSAPHTYRVFTPKEGVRNWAAQIDDPEIEGFYIRPGYDMNHPLYSPAGGYVVAGDVADPYSDKLDDVWLVQQPLFESTYEMDE